MPSSDAVTKSVITTAKNLSVYCSVCSCNCVAAWTTATSNPTADAAMIGGAESSRTSHSAFDGDVDDRIAHARAPARHSSAPARG